MRPALTSHLFTSSFQFYNFFLLVIIILNKNAIIFNRKECCWYDFYCCAALIYSKTISFPLENELAVNNNKKICNCIIKEFNIRHIEKTEALGEKKETAGKLLSQNQIVLLTVGMKITKVAEFHMSINFMYMFYQVVLSVYRLNPMKAQPRAKLPSFFLFPCMKVCTGWGEMCLSIGTYAPTYILTRALWLPLQWIIAFGNFWLLIETGDKMNREPLAGCGVPNGWLPLKLFSSRTESYWSRAECVGTNSRACGGPWQVIFWFVRKCFHCMRYSTAMDVEQQQEISVHPMDTCYSWDRVEQIDSCKDFFYLQFMKGHFLQFEQCI